MNAHRGRDIERKVSWLELFFDLVFAAAVSQVALPLRDDYSAAGLVRFAILFILIWWAWTGHAVFSTRFHTDDGVQRLLTLLQMFGVAVMAANARDALDSRSSAGFAAAYAALRLILVAQYIRARTVVDARRLIARYAGGHGVAAFLWLASAVAPLPERYWLWGVALAIDLGTPWWAERHSAAFPPDASHLPERFGLFTLILLGESVIAVMHGIEHQEHWSVTAASLAFLSMAIALGIWWGYFDAARATRTRPVRSRGDAVRLHIWSYAHLPFYVGMVVTFVGLQLVVSAAPAVIALHEAVLLGIALSVVGLSLVPLSTASGGQHA